MGAGIDGHICDLSGELHPEEGIVTLNFQNWERYHDLPRKAGRRDKE
jgi:hypothetical protein